MLKLTPAQRRDCIEFLADIGEEQPTPLLLHRSTLTNLWRVFDAESSIALLLLTDSARRKRPPVAMATERLKDIIARDTGGALMERLKQVRKGDQS